jgi:hypothetical protein
MLHLDLPTRPQIDRLLGASHPASVSIYLRTDPVSHGDAERIELRTLAADAIRQLSGNGIAKPQLASIDEAVADLVDDDQLWRYQARSMAVFINPDESQVFRLANRLDTQLEVADRFYVKPLIRAITFPQAAYVLAIAQGSWRLLRIMADSAPVEVTPDGAPDDVAEAANVHTIRDRAPRGKIQGSEGQKVRMRQYAMQVDRAIRPVIAGSHLPLILAAAEPLASIYRSVNTYPHLASSMIAGNPEQTTAATLSEVARPILDEIYAAQIADYHAAFDRHSSTRRGITDLSDIARAATQGLIDTAFVSIEEAVYGTVDDEGSIDYADGPSADVFGIADEIARRTWMNGGKVYAVRHDEVPGGGSAAAILRFAP